MGKGDQRSKKGKINSGSYGVSRPRPSLKAKAKAAAGPTAPSKPKKEKAAAKPAKPAAVKKTTKKKTEE